MCNVDSLFQLRVRMVLEHCVDNADDCFMWATSMSSWQPKFMEPYSDQERGNRCASDPIYALNSETWAPYSDQERGRNQCGLADLSRSARANCHFCTMRTWQPVPVVHIVHYLVVTVLVLGTWAACSHTEKALDTRSRNIPFFLVRAEPGACFCDVECIIEGTAVAVVQNLYFCCNNKAFLHAPTG
jgi:hypothetical protein